MFVLFFAIFIFLFTIFENIFIVSIVFILSLIVILSPLRKGEGAERKRDLYKQIGICVLAFLFAIGSVFLYNYRSRSSTAGQIPEPHVQTTSPVFIGTGQILDRQGQGKYIIQKQKLTYILVSRKDYKIGDQIRLVGNIKMTESVNETSILNFPSIKIFSGIFHYQFNYDKRLKMKGIQGTIFEQNSIIVKNIPGGVISSLRIGLQNLIKNSYGQNKTAGLILGMIIGEKSQIPESEYQSFIDSGLVHLIAVSGGNIIMIVIFLGCILMWIPFYIRNGVILMCIIMYGFLCGMDSSVFRAVIMGGLGMVALFRGRQIDIRRSLSIAFVGMLLFNPYFLVYDIGFLFSFSAIIGLIYFGKIGQIPEKSNKLKIGLNYAIQNYLSPSIGATIGILPTMIFFMGKINLLGSIGNILVIPIVPFVMIYGFISTILYQLIPRHGFLQIEERLIQYIYWISEKLSEYGLYMNVEGDRIKYLILGLAIIRFIWKKFHGNSDKIHGINE